MRALTKQQRGAVYLVIATVLTGVGRLIEPGVFVASGTKWYDLVEVRAAMADNAALEHVSSLLYAFGLLWLIGGLLTLRVHVKDEGVAGTAVRSGALFAGMALFIMALIEGLDHMTLRVVQDGIGAGADTDQVALALLSTKLGITFFVWPIFYAGIAMAAFGMARLLTAGGYRAISSITALLAAITAVLIVLVEHIEANNFWQAVGVIMGVVLLIWLLATAHAMYKEKIPSATA